jgi:hypothetical protein
MLEYSVVIPPFKLFLTTCSDTCMRGYKGKTKIEAIEIRILKRAY